MSDFLEKGRKYLEDKISGRVDDSNQYESIDDIVNKNEYRDSISEVMLEPLISEDRQSNTPSEYKNLLMGSYDEIIESTEKIDDARVRNGVRSIVNPFAMISFHKGDVGKVHDYMNSRDKPEQPIDSENLSIEKLVTYFNDVDYPSKPYRYSDFAFSKYFEKIPLNRLITLRRFPFPTFDNLDFPNTKENSPKPIVRPIAQAVTFFGEPTGNDLSKLLNMKGSIGWKKLTAEYQQKSGTDQDLTKDPLGGRNKVIRGISKASHLINGTSDISQRKFTQIQGEKNFDWSNTVRGESDVIKTTHIREKGIEAGVEKYDITFEYMMRSFNGVNGKVAMLDVIFNFLSLVYNNADFWGGSRRFYPNSPRYPFLGDQEAFYKGDYGTYAKSIGNALGESMGTIGSTFQGILQGMLNGDLSSIINTLTKVGTSLMDVASGRDRPQMISFKALLSGEPIGDWHLSIGSPIEPIAMIGNLICESWSLEFGEELGVDNFPTTFKFVVNLKDGMPRDKGGIESILTNGNGHGYLKPSEFKDLIGTDGATGKVTEEDIKRAGGSVF